MDFNKHTIRLVQQCPVCGKTYQENSVEIIDEKGNSFIAYLSCRFCQSNLIVRVVSMPQGLMGSAILTDLGSEEVVKFFDLEAVNADDVLNVHQKIHNNEFTNYLIKD